MLGIQIGTEFLELAPGAALEMERSNPSLQFNDVIAGEYSLPLSVQLSPKNLKLLKYAGLLQTRINNKGVDAIAYDGGLQHSSGKLKVEKIDHNLNRSAAGSASLYYLTGISAFNQDAKNVKLRSGNYGGNRSFAWDGYNRSGGGFWGHIHSVVDAAPGAYDYAFYPVINKSWSWEYGHTEVMNRMEYDGQVHFSTVTTKKDDANVIVPFPYLKYVLQQAVAQIGWRIEGDILSDPDFLKITMLNFKSIDWARVDLKVLILGGDASPIGDTITFNLKDHLPDISLTDFIIALKNRFGWRYDFDTKKKILRINPLRSLVNGTVKDFTSQASPLLAKKVLSEKRVYSLKNTFTGEYAGEQPNFQNLTILGDLITRNELPAPSEIYFAKGYYVVAENNYYTCRQNEDESWSWTLFAYNIYDVVPDDATEEITTAATTIGVEGYDDYLQLAPRFDQNGLWIGRTEEDITWGIHLLFYHGLQLNAANQMYPFASNHIYDALGNQVGNWSLAFKGKRRDGVDVGLYSLNWKALLDSINSGEEFEVTLHLSRTEYMKLQFSDVPSIAHVRMFILKIKHNVPYDNKVVLECSRI